MVSDWIQEGKIIKYNYVNWKISKNVNFHTQNIIYMIKSKKEKCKSIYIGESARTLKDRLAEYKTIIKSFHLNQPKGEHFNQIGHSLSDMTITIRVSQKTQSMKIQWARWFFW